MKRPTIIVVIEDGVVINVITDVDCYVEIVDFDTDGASDEDIVRLPHPYNLKSKDCYLYEGIVNDTDPDKANLFKNRIKKLDR